MSNPNDVGKSKKRVLDSRKRGKVQHKSQKKHNNNVNDEIKDKIQLETDKFINARLENIDSDDKKKESFKVDEANAITWTEDSLKKLSKKD